MAISGWTLSRAAGLVTVAVVAAAAIGQSVAGMGEWKSVTDQELVLATRTSMPRQPRPASAPTGSNGHAVELLGTIESVPPLRQPRPVSAAPRRLDHLIENL